MRPRTLLVLFALVAVLGAFIWFFERELPSSEERAELAKRVFREEAGEVTAVVVERGAERLRLERAPASGDGEEPPGETGGENGGAEAADAGTKAAVSGGWRLVEPLTARAADDEVEALVDAVLELEWLRELDGVEPADAGLEPPRAVVTVETADGPRRLAVGGEVPASQNMIVAAGAGGALYVVSNTLWDDLDRAPGDWRSRDVFDVERAAILRVRLVDGERSLLLARRGEPFWIEAPEVDRAHEDRVSELLGDLTALEVGDFVDEPPATPAEMGLEPPQARVELLAEGSAEPLVLDLGGDANEAGDRRYARFGGQLVEIGRGLDEALARPLEAWRSDAWSALESWEVDAVTVVENGEETTLERVAGEWKRGEETVPYGVVSDLLYAVTGAAAERLLERGGAAKAADLDAAELEIRLSADGDREEILRLHGEAEDGRLATTGGRDRVLLLSPATVDDLRMKLEAVRDVEPEAADEAVEGVDGG